MIKKPENKLARVSLAAKPTAIPITPAEANQAVGLIPQMISNTYEPMPISKILPIKENSGMVFGWMISNLCSCRDKVSKNKCKTENPLTIQTKVNTLARNRIKLLSRPSDKPTVLMAMAKKKKNSVSSSSNNKQLNFLNNKI